MGIYFNPSNESFKKDRNYKIYVDKTELLEYLNELVETPKNCVAVSHARRFGKSHAAGMIDAYYSLGCDSSNLFENTKITEHADYKKYMNQYNVIHLDISSVWDFHKEDIVEAVKERIIDDFKEEYGEDLNYSKDINRLINDIYRKTNTPFVIIIDEWDCVIRNSDDKALVHQYLQFLHSLFKSEESKTFLALGYITGILPIKKIWDESALNNFCEYTMLKSKPITKFYGFTEEEVKVGLARVGLLDYREKVKEWYDGFTFGQRRDMYNPWSITKFIDAEGIFDTYWANTSNNKLVSSLIRKSSKNMKMAMEQLLEGEMLHVEMDEHLDFAQLEYRESAIFSLLYATGYLRVNQKNDQEYVLMLTNKEVEIMFRRIIREWFNDMDTGYGDFRRALLHDNIEEMNYYMNMVTLSTFSYFDTGTGRGNIDETERFYYGFVLGLLADLSDQFSIRSNRESGLGRYDIILRAREEYGNSYIMEFKVFDRERDENMKACVARALQQIEEKQYETELVADGIARERIRKYGFAFDGKKVLIGS